MSLLFSGLYDKLNAACDVQGGMTVSIPALLLCGRTTTKTAQTEHTGSNYALGMPLFQSVDAVMFAIGVYNYNHSPGLWLMPR